MSDYDSDEDISVALLKRKIANTIDDSVSTFSEEEDWYDSDQDPEYRQNCEVIHCKNEVWAACHGCLILVCWEHFHEEITSCTEHGTRSRKETDEEESAIESNIACEQRQNVLENMEKTVTLENTIWPENFIVEGSARETAISMKRRKNIDCRNAKKKRDRLDTSTQSLP